MSQPDSYELGEEYLGYSLVSLAGQIAELDDEQFESVRGYVNETIMRLSKRAVRRKEGSNER